MELFFIINGIETRVHAKSTDTVENLAKIALQQTEMEARPRKPVDEWFCIYENTSLAYHLELKEQWKRIDIDKTELLNIKDGDTIFMAIKAGVGA